MSQSDPLPDDPALREALTDILDALGYETCDNSIHIRHDAHHASFTYYNRHGTPFRVAITRDKGGYG